VFVILSLAGLIAILSSTMSKSPTLPLFAKYLNANENEIGLIASASTITGIIVNVVSGTLSDIYGKRKMLIISGFFFASSPLLYLIVNEAWQLILIRVYHGVATAIFTPVAIASIASMYKSKRGEAIGAFSSFVTIGRLLAPLIVGGILSLAGFKETYVVCGLTGLFAFIILLNLPKFEEENLIKRKTVYKLRKYYLME